MPLALTTLFGNVKLLSNFCILQNILNRDLGMRILFVVFQCTCNSYMESCFCSGRGIYILQKMKFLLKRQCIWKRCSKNKLLYFLCLYYLVKNTYFGQQMSRTDQVTNSQHISRAIFSRGIQQDLYKLCSKLPQ